MIYCLHLNRLSLDAITRDLNHPGTWSIIGWQQLFALTLLFQLLTIVCSLGCASSRSIASSSSAVSTLKLALFFCSQQASLALTLSCCERSWVESIMSEKPLQQLHSHWRQW